MGKLKDSIVNGNLVLNNGIDEEIDDAQNLLSKMKILLNDTGWQKLYGTEGFSAALQERLLYRAKAGQVYVYVRILGDINIPTWHVGETTNKCVVGTLPPDCRPSKLTTCLLSPLDDTGYEIQLSIDVDGTCDIATLGGSKTKNYCAGIASFPQETITLN